MNQVIDDINALPYGKYRDWKDFMIKYDCKAVAEIGVRQGLNFEKMIEHGPELAVAVDLWKNTGNMAQNDLDYTQEKLDKQYLDFKNKYIDTPGVMIHRGYSDQAAKWFEDETFDFVYIDADHTYDGVKADLEAWYPKVKKGKFLMGDDFRRHKTRTGVRFGVVEAVTRFAHINGLSFFVFPRSKWGLIK